MLTVNQWKITSDDGLVLWYPTFCPTSRGLRMFATAFPVTNSGHFHTTVMEAEAAHDELQFFGIPDSRKCRTVRLTSQIKGE